MGKNLSKIHHGHYPGGETGFGRVTYRRGGRLGPRRQAHYELVMIHRGEMRVAIDGREHRVGAGEGILLEPGREEFFRFSDRRETTHSWCQLPPAELPPALAFPATATGRVARGGKWLLGFMDRGWAIPSDLETAEGRTAMLGAVLCAMGQFCSALAAPRPGRKPPEALVRAREVMEARLAEPLPLAEWARAAALSKGHFIKLAREHWGATPGRYLWQARVEAGARLLRETGLTIGEIADRTGFANPFHFSRRFRLRFGKDPRAWRAAVWGKGIGPSVRPMRK